MNKIYSNLNVDNLMKTEKFNQFNNLQQEEIKQGLEKELDISIYAKPEYNWQQMKEIRWGLEDNLDVSIYANSENDWKQMRKTRNLLVSKKGHSLY